jgi:large conductance mechanosensitive channel
VPAGTPATLDAVKKAGVPVFAYGNFITIVLYFLILAWIIFVMVKWMNKLRRSEPSAPPEDPEEVKLLREIRDSLKR